MKKPDKQSDDEKVKDLIQFGSEIAGGATGAAIGLLVAGPAGAIAGAIGGPIVARTLKSVAVDIKERFLSKKEEQRIGATVALTMIKINENLEKGKTLRNDGFFEPGTNERSAIEEIYEGTLIAAQKEHEEKKIKFYSNLVANLSFSIDFDKAEANVLLKKAEGLTYRQLCILSLLGRIDQYSLRQTSYREAQVDDSRLIILLEEINDLYNKTMVISSARTAFISLVDVTPSELSLIGTGEFLHGLMELSEIPTEDLDEIASILS